MLESKRYIFQAATFSNWLLEWMCRNFPERKLAIGVQIHLIALFDGPRCGRSQRSLEMCGPELQSNDRYSRTHLYTYTHARTHVQGILVGLFVFWGLIFRREKVEKAGASENRVNVCVCLHQIEPRPWGRDSLSCNLSTHQEQQQQQQQPGKQAGGENVGCHLRQVLARALARCRVARVMVRLNW